MARAYHSGNMSIVPLHRFGCKICIYLDLYSFLSSKGFQLYPLITVFVTRLTLRKDIYFSLYAIFKKMCKIIIWIILELFVLIMDCMGLRYMHMLYPICKFIRFANRTSDLQTSAHKPARSRINVESGVKKVENGIDFLNHF